MENAEHPVLVVDMKDPEHRRFRVTAAAFWSVQNNLSIANMDFGDFYSNTDADGVFRGF